jgi:hypothetical protein
MSAITDVEKNNALGSRHMIADTVISNTDLAKLKQLVGWMVGGNWATARETGTSSGYVVPSGKKFVVVAVRLQRSGGAGAATSLAGLSAATSDVGFNSGSAPTGTDGGTATLLGNVIVDTATNALTEVSLPYEIPAGKYVALYSQLNESFWHVYGFEIDVTATTI